MLSRPFPLEGPYLKKSQTSATRSGWRTTRILPGRLSWLRRRLPLHLNSVNSNLATLMVDSGTSGHYFDGAIIRNLKHHLQDYVHLATPRTILNAGGAMLKCTAKGVLQGLVTDDNGNQILFQVEIVVVGRIGHNLFSVTKAAKQGMVTTFDYENPRLEIFNAAVPLRSESGDLYSFMLDLSADRYGANELAMKAVANVQVWHWRLGHLHAQSLDILHKQDGTGIIFERAVSDCNFCAVGKTQQLTHLMIADHKVNPYFQLCYGDRIRASRQWL